MTMTKEEILALTVKPASLMAWIRWVMKCGGVFNSNQIHEAVLSELNLDMNVLGFDKRDRPVLRNKLNSAIFRMKNAKELNQWGRGLFALESTIDVPHPDTLGLLDKKKSRKRKSKTQRQQTQRQQAPVVKDPVVKAKPEIMFAKPDPISVPVLEGTPTPDWMEDPYLVSLVENSMSCFGTYLETNKTCKACPLRVNCAVALEAAAKALVAERAEREESKARALELKKVEQEAAASKPEVNVHVAPRDAINIVASSRGECVLTGLIVQPDDQAWYSPSTGMVYHGSLQRGE